MLGDNDRLLTTAGIGVYKGKPRLQLLKSGKIHLANREWKVFPVGRKVPMKMGFLIAGTKTRKRMTQTVLKGPVCHI